jgi:hypothetical protein
MIKFQSSELELISPRSIDSQKRILKDLAKFGINHLNKSPDLGWNYVLDHSWLFQKFSGFISSVNDPKKMIILDVGTGRSFFHNFLEQRLGINILGIDRPSGYCHQDEMMNVDYLTDFLTFNDLPDSSVDAIYWLSAIEHNDLEMIGKLFEKSISLLKPGGMFLATVPVAPQTQWFSTSVQTNMAIADIQQIFNIELVSGNYPSIHSEYRKNILYLKDKYKKRYGGFKDDDPAFIVGGISVIK